MAENDLKQFIKEEGEKTRKYVDEKAVETQRHFDVVAEHLTSEIQTVAEQVGTNTEKITEIQEKLEQHDGRFETIEITLEVIKQDVNFIKHELKQKVDRDEFAALERRVGMLETKFRPA